jgi:hypothetical protein
LIFSFPKFVYLVFVNEFKRFTGRAYKKILGVYRGYHLWFYYGEKDSYAVGENIIRKIIKNPKFAKKLQKKKDLKFFFFLKIHRRNSK